MNTSKPFVALTTVVTMVMSVLILPGYAEPDSDSNRLLPLEARNMSVETDPERLQTVTEEINASTRQDAGNSDGSDVIGSELLDSLVDEDGDLSLPLGITVFSTLGDPAVGFGGDF